MTQEVTHRAHIDIAYDILKGLANSASQQSPVYSLWRQLSVNNSGPTRPTKLLMEECRVIVFCYVQM